MPSGDAASCAYQCTWLLFVFQMPSFMVFILPLCMLGRVYAQCHWFGDTIIGSTIGCLCSYFFLRYIHVLGLPLLKFIMTISPTTSIILSLLSTIFILLQQKILSCKRNTDNTKMFTVQKRNCNNLN